MTELLLVKNLNKSYQTPSGKLEVLSELNFTLNTGEFLAIRGESGSGKSTLLHCIAGLDNFQSGEIFLNGEALHKMKASRFAELRNHQMGFVFQSHHLLADFTALENCIIPAAIYSGQKNSHRRRAEELLERVGLSARMNHRLSELSGGEAQRVAIARALINQPELVLADEPTGNLDPERAADTAKLFQELCRQENSSVLMVTHSENLLKYCDRQLNLEKGQLSE